MILSLSSFPIIIVDCCVQ